ncbi:MAG: hypothetical protein BM557_06235 [Flavobacterium sp. MedPE-SWcel]|uniref:hypothetical protein n=1 Tax=uncultured Flavobacterium sp. TaxID=165435 RepID=UPI000922F6A1|nr:hypothetical protein [uncultured Flavobacterium sp.]OIQ19300.1 MAG: hypothetical protein BM557_06235 [Flavobacterium sp. MedPE-SWcel]
MDQHSKDTLNMMKKAFSEEVAKEKLEYNQNLEARLNELSGLWGGRLTEQQRAAETKKFEAQNLPELKQTITNLEQRHFEGYGGSIEKAEKFFTAYERNTTETFNDASKQKAMTAQEQQEQEKKDKLKKQELEKQQQQKKEQELHNQQQKEKEQKKEQLRQQLQQDRQRQQEQERDRER